MSLQPATERVPAARSAVSNGSRLHYGVDGRSRESRRFRDLIESFSADFGGMAGLNEQERALVRQAAAITVRAEQLQADIVSGKPVDPDELIRLSNTARRLLDAIPTKRERAKPQTIADILQAEPA